MTFTREMNNRADYVYAGVIVDQALNETADGALQVILTVRLDAKLRDGQDINAGSDPCDPFDVPTIINLALGQYLDLALANLRRLGFEGDEFDRLHPDHPEAVLLLDRPVHMRKRAKGGAVYWNLVWPRRQASLGQAQSAAARLKQHLAKADGRPTDGEGAPR